MEDEINGKESAVKTNSKTNAQVDQKSTMCYAMRFALLSLMVLCLPMSAQAFPGDLPGDLLGGVGAEIAKEEKQAYDLAHTSDLLAIIRVPVKLHHLPHSGYRVTCAAYDRPHGSLVIRGDGYTNDVAPLSGEVDSTVEVEIYPLKSVKDRTFPMVTWLCHLSVMGHDSKSGLRGYAKAGQPYNDNVGGSWTLEAGRFIAR